MENINNQMNAAPEKKKSKKKWIIIVVAIVLLFAIIGSSGDSENTGTTIEALSQADSDAISPSENVTTTEQSNIIKAGSSVSDKQIKISYKSCNTDFEDYSEYADVKDGYKIIEAIFDFENISDSDVFVDGFECYADGVKCESFFYVDNYSFPYESISSGRKLTDVAVYYEVPADAEKIELEYEINVWSEEKYIFIVE